MQECGLVATDIACRRGDRILFRGLSLSVRSGGIVHLAGPNGIGKSSLIRILAGLLRPYAGTVERTGGIALADERLALDGHQPLAQALAFWQRIDRAEPEQADFGLADLLDVPVRYLSTGQRKRAALARVAASGAPLWLLDEPLNGLDTYWSSKAQVAIAAHCRAGGAVVIASHQPLALEAVHEIKLLDFQL
ncbi:MAG: heme ABC exporter ATP-binding protein CcmA [Novosphingobium sp. 28-62-57]|uniref:heme ABC exporter ATP-binding protein CcmA n=1 Tax=unclassified Novosphingobium TaxID=2644732 RepID=UPI000BD2A482|nr:MULTISPECIES: heme ABC exporter ATP-binding protein CcmA [unclassified Novosphingobium]OYW50825.1 MAG: heme ABC exporter ATP-binding protein CcmA [Novosphingobium sp. 12-62-10]OYZ10037.1 MAG: heme ABC exporter ATP-binding protein CcmA [Novosphingobium sp. 28-62-57]